MAAGAEATQREIEKLLFLEARLLDTGRFEEWLGLFTEDGRYWVPSQPGQTDPLNVPSIMYEDCRVLTMRMQRLSHPRAHILLPMPRTTHVVGNIDVLDEAGEEPRVESTLIMVEYRENRKQIYSGRCLHHLRRVDGALRITLKRVDLVDCDALHGAMTIPF